MTTRMVEGTNHHHHHHTYVCTIYIYIYDILKTLRVTAVSKGDGMIFEQGGNQGIGRNQQDPSGNVRFTRLGESQRASWGLRRAPQALVKCSGGSQRSLTPSLIEIV